MLDIPLLFLQVWHAKQAFGKWYGDGINRVVGVGYGVVGKQPIKIKVITRNAFNIIWVVNRTIPAYYKSP